MTDRLLNSYEVAERLHSSRSYAYLLMTKGLLPTVRVGGLVRVRETDLEAYIVTENAARQQALLRKRKPRLSPRAKPPKP